VGIIIYARRISRHIKEEYTKRSEGEVVGI